MEFDTFQNIVKIPTLQTQTLRGDDSGVITLTGHLEGKTTIEGKWEPIGINPVASEANKGQVQILTYSAPVSNYTPMSLSFTSLDEINITFKLIKDISSIADGVGIGFRRARAYGRRF